MEGLLFLGAYAWKLSSPPGAPWPSRLMLLCSAAVCEIMYLRPTYYHQRSVRKRMKIRNCMCTYSQLYAAFGLHSAFENQSE